MFIRSTYYIYLIYLNIVITTVFPVDIGWRVESTAADADVCDPELGQLMEAAQ